MAGPGGLLPGNYPPQNLSQDQRQYLWEYFGHSGTAPVGYGGEGGSGASGGFPDFNFDYQAEQEKAYESLKPFYEKLLQFSQGDLDLAKRMLSYTYEQGMRENTFDYQQQVAEEQRLAPEETSQLLTSQNQRGVLQSGFGNTARENLKSRQSARAEAIQRAYEDKTSRLEKEKEFGTEQSQNTFEQNKFQQERERRQEAQDITQSQFGIKSSQYQVELGKAQRLEQQRLRELEQKTQQDFYNQYLS